MKLMSCLVIAGSETVLVAPPPGELMGPIQELHNQNQSIHTQ